MAAVAAVKRADLVETPGQHLAVARAELAGDREQVLVLGATLSGAVDWVPFTDPALKDFMVSELGRR